MWSERSGGFTSEAQKVSKHVHKVIRKMRHRNKSVWYFGNGMFYIIVYSFGLFI